MRGEYSLSDIAAATGNNGNYGFGDGNGAWWLIILLFNFWVETLHLVHQFSLSVLSFVYSIGISIFDVNTLNINSKIVKIHRQH